MSEHFVANTKMVTIECYKCHILFAVPKEFYEKAKRFNEELTFYCPSGHPQHYIGKSKIKQPTERLADEQNCCISAREEANTFERRLRATKGVVTKPKKKASGD